MEKGICLWFDAKKGYGFLRGDDIDTDVFVHYSNIVADPGEFKLLEENDLVEFETFLAERDGRDRLQAKNVRKSEMNQ